MTIHRAFLCLLAIFLGGCVHLEDRVLFVTETSLGIDLDTVPPNASIAYHRIEGYYGPRNENGAVPSVYAKIQLDGSLFTPKVRQLYATGESARALANASFQPNSPKMRGKREVMFFGTSTTTGIRMGFSPAGIPDSFLVGFKRSEISFIPLGERVVTPDGIYLECSPENKRREECEDTYPSVLAILNTKISGTSQEDVSLHAGQFFATGYAADYLALHDPNVRELFQTEASDSARAYLKSLKAQQEPPWGTGWAHATVRTDMERYLLTFVLDSDSPGDQERTELLKMLQALPDVKDKLGYFSPTKEFHDTLETFRSNYRQFALSGEWPKAQSLP